MSALGQKRKCSVWVEHVCFTPESRHQTVGAKTSAFSQERTHSKPKMSNTVLNPHSGRIGTLGQTAKGNSLYRLWPHSILITTHARVTRYGRCQTRALSRLAS